MAKKPKIKEVPSPDKIPKWISDPDIDGSGPISWRFSHCDNGGPFSWANIQPEDSLNLISCLTGFETKNWTEIERSGSHEIECHRLEKSARDRLVEIGHDDLDALMSFRISGACRVWLIKDGAMMRALWWDPRHEVYLVPKDRGDRKKRHRRR